MESTARPVAGSITCNADNHEIIKTGNAGGGLVRLPMFRRFSLPQTPIRFASSIAACALLAACGGGGGGTNSTPAPAPTPTPSPTPTPTPTPTNFDTAEYRRSDGPEFHGAISAWQAGYTGAGSIIAVIDTGIDQDSPEFTGRIHPDSTDVAANRGIDAEDDHGTNVAMVAAAARDDTGILGMAWDAQVLVLRADDPGSCATETPDDPSSGCQFDDRNIAAGVDRAIASGASVINISLGGGSATSVLTSAVARASAAGIVVIVSAGNGGDGSDPAIDPAQPDPFASSLLAAGGNNVIIVGSIDENGVISDFSNRAGNDAAFYLTARGEAICCTYDNGQLYVDADGFVYLFSGTSFSAPQVSGAVALLAQAFPNLTGAQIVEILLDTARDAGATGTDAVYGRGILDIASAVAPQGTTTLAGTGYTLVAADNFGLGSSAMGDALDDQPLRAIVLDKYQRAYEYDLTTRLRGAELRPRLHAAAGQASRSISASSDGLAMAFTVADGARSAKLGWAEPLQLTQEDARQAEVLAARVTARLSPQTQLGVAYAQGAGGLTAQLQGHSRPAFRIAPAPDGDDGFVQQADMALALRHQIGPWGMTLFAEQGDASLAGSRYLFDLPSAPHERRPVTSMGFVLDRQVGGVEGSLGLSWMAEQDTVLGGYFHSSLGASGADTAFLDASARAEIAHGWSVGGAFRQGVTMPHSSSILAASSRLYSTAWSLDLSRNGVIGAHDWLGLRVSQPLRVARGGLNLMLPVAYDYATETPEYGLHRLNLAPDGREVMGELAWQGPTAWGWGAASLFYRHQPGHYADQPADVGLLLRWSSDF